jgi:hypothetical protein
MKSFGVPVVMSVCMGVVLVMAGCAVWKPAWKNPPTASATGDVDRLMAEADLLSSQADSREDLLAVLSDYEAVLAVEPTHYRALASLGHYYILLGTAYTPQRSEKTLVYRKALYFNEMAMYTNPDFKQRVDGGEKPWDACDALTDDQIDVMFYWVTGVLTYFKECFTLPEMVVNVRWIERCGKFLDRIEALDDTWGGGGVQFSQALVYGILPKSMGGDRDKSDAYLSRSIDIGSDWLLSRWGRAKFFQVRDQNRQGFIEDLQWVLEKDFDAAKDVYAWKIYFKRDARQMLADVDRYF